MGGIIIAMPKAEDAARIEEMLKNAGFEDMFFSCRTGSQVLMNLRDRDADLVICTKKLSDMGYEEIVEYMPSYANLILLTKDASIYSSSSNVIRLLLPFRSANLVDAISMFRGPIRLKKKKPPTVRTDQDKKIIDSAKQLLMVRYTMDEPEAFRYLQKSSMDTGRSMVETAQMVLVLNSE